MKEFSIKKKIYYHDTDCGNVVYYSNYLKYFEEARTEHLLSKGIEIPKLIERGIFFVVAGVDIKYKSPARYSDNLVITSKIAKIKNVSIEFHQEVRRKDTLLVTCTAGLVMVNKDLKPASIPQDIAALLKKD